MRWNKRGLVYGPDGTMGWAAHSALQPTPLVIGDVIRVFCGFRDAEGRSSVGFVDVAAEDPSRVLGASQRPALGRGAAGAFDESGVVPCAVIERDRELWLYYAGYSRDPRPGARFSVFAGLAVSDDGGETFARRRDGPIMPPTEQEPLFRVVHSIHPDGEGWKVWYGAGSHFRQGRAKALPVYDIRYAESQDGVTFPAAGVICVPLRPDEHRVGRPYVVRTREGYRMFFGAGTEATTYRLALARSSDGLQWERVDKELGLDVSVAGWDSEMMAYPAVATVGGRTFLFYNGNEYGREGFGFAELVTDGATS